MLRASCERRRPGYVEAPRPPSFNEEDVSDKPSWIEARLPLTEGQIGRIDELHRKRLRSLLAVDEMIKRLVESLQYSRKLSKTYILFTSDNGWHEGEHRREKGKWSAYEEDIRVPLIVRGPGVPEGVGRTHMVLNNDLAPTFAGLGGVSPPAFVDGGSFVKLLRARPPSPSKWRSAFLAEALASGATGRPAYEAVRTQTHLWAEYATGERELYNLSKDPYELQSRHKTAPDDFKRYLSSRACLQSSYLLSEDPSPSPKPEARALALRRR